MKFKRTIIAMEIFLIISLSISFSYLIRESSKTINNYPENNSLIKDKLAFNSLNPMNNKVLLKILGILNKALWNENSFASALNVDDLSNGAWTCLKSKDGSLCQQYPASECSSKCDGECIPTTRNNVPQCKLGTCYNAIEGTCSLNAPKALCEAKNDTWLNDAYGNVQQCKLGCCLINGNAQLATEQQCNRQASLLGSIKTFRTDIRDPVSCRNLMLSQTEGACLYGKNDEGKNLCKFTTREDCQKIRGDFRENLLCSNPALNTNCEKQKTTSCVFGKDEVYWFDSCGNRENIYSYPKAGSYNNGFLLKKEQSCLIASGNNLVANKQNCGNCDYLLGSSCRKAKTGEVAVGDFVCGDLSCIDEFGNKRYHGESWCSYQGSTGLDGNRATDTAGSRHFRSTCVRGEVNVEPCADFRNEICVEARTQLQENAGFSTAACTLNTWQQCISYNEKGKENLCAKNPDCFVKKVALGDFRFNVCAGKYPPGFLLEEGGRGETAETICSIASQKCIKVMVKKLSGWKCKAGCECDKPEFTQQMNDLCISLGDCGMKANYLGDISNSYKVTNAPALSEAYKGAFVRYANEKEFIGKFATPGDINLLYGTLGIPEGLGDANINVDASYNKVKQTSGSVSTALTIAGILSLLALKTQIGLGLLFNLGVPGVLAGYGVAGNIAGAKATFIVSPALKAFGGALTGASIGFTVVSLLIKMTGVGRGLSSGVTYGLMAAGAIGGAMAGYAVMNAITTAAATGAAKGSAAIGALASGVGLVGVITIVVVIIIIVVMKLLGIGKVKRIDISFQCKPWQAPVGGNECGKCGSDGKTCSRYACSSLGQTCELINEDSDSPECIDAGRGDVSSPIISPWRDFISLAHNYTNIQENGVKIESYRGCLEPYTNLFFGLQLNEPSQCKYDLSHKNEYKDMEYDFGTSSLFKRNHSMMLPIPSIEALGYNQYVPNASAQYNLYVRCRDKRGNWNLNEYAISFCIQRGIDFSPPVILYKEPLNNIVGFNERNQNVSLLINEPSTCKYDKEDKAYSEMRYEMQCENDIEEQTALGIFAGWKCNNVFSTENEQNKYYVRCNDWPWLANRSVNVFTIAGVNYSYSDGNVDWNFLNRKNAETGNLGITNVNLNETIITNILDSNRNNKTQSRNANTLSYVLELNKTRIPLQIDSISPDNETLVFGVSPASVEIVAYTSGGLDGNAKCSYEYANNNIEFLETFARVHRQQLNALFSGNYNIKIKCEDEIGNTAEKNAKFTIKLDNSPPLVSRAYANGNTLYIITDENAQCFYANEGCNYEFMNGSLMSGDARIHTSSLEKGKAYYIKCKDEFNNHPGSLCSVLVRRA